MPKANKALEAAKFGSSAANAALGAAGPAGLIAGGIATIGLQILGGIFGKTKDIIGISDKDLASYKATGQISSRPDQGLGGSIMAMQANSDPNNKLRKAYDAAVLSVGNRDAFSLSQSSGTTFLKYSTTEALYRNPVSDFLPRDLRSIPDPYNQAKASSGSSSGSSGSSGGKSAANTVSSKIGQIKTMTEPSVRSSNNVVTAENRRKRQMLNSYTRASTIRTPLIGTGEPILAVAGNL